MAMLRFASRPPTSRSSTAPVPMSANSERGKNTSGLPARSRVKNSASAIGMPSSTFFRDETDGLTRFCSMSEIRPLVTPARLASSRCERPYIWRTAFRCAPTSMLIVCIILNTSAECEPKIEESVEFLYHSACPRCPTATLPHEDRMNARITPATAKTDLDAFWMPFTANRQFKSQPRLLAKAEGMHYWTPEGREVLDAVAGLWCVNAGHSRREITEAVTKQIGTMDFAPTFQMGHPIGFELANRLAAIAP